MHHIFRIIIVFLCLFNLVFLHHSFAQEVAADLQADTLKLKEVIPTGQIVGKTAEDQQYLNRIRDDLYSEEELESIKIEIDTIIHEFKIILKGSSVESEKFYRTQELERKKRIWVQLEKRISRSENDLENAVDNISMINNKITKLQNSWNQTRELLKDEDIYKVLDTRISELLLVSDTVNDLFSRQLNELITQQTRLVEYELQANEVIKTLNEKLEERNVSKIRMTKDPIWKMRRHAFDSLSIAYQIRTSLKDENETLNLFLSSYRDDVTLYITSLIVSLVFFVTLYFKTKKHELLKEGKFNVTFIEHLYRKPIAVSLVISAYSSYFILESAPPLLVEFIILTICAGLIPLIYVVFKKRTAYLIYLFFFLFIVVRILKYTWVQTINIQLIHLAIILSALAGLWYLRQSIRTESITGNKYISKLAVGMLGICFALMLGSLISNISGAGQLSELITRGVIRFVAASILFFISMLIFEGLLYIFLQSKTVMGIHLFNKNKESIFKFSFTAIRIIFFLFFINSILRILGLQTRFSESMGNWLNDPRTIGDFEFTYGSIFLFIAIIYLSVILSRVLKAVIEDGVLYNFNLKKGLALSIGTLTKYIVITSGFLLAVSAAGLEMDKITVLIGAFGVGIGFGLQNIFNNLVSGLILLFDRPIQVNDTVEVGNLVGKVQQIGLRASNVRTFDGAEVIVPNGEFISKEVINWTLSDQQRRMELNIGVAYGSDLHKVKDVISGVLEAHEEVIKFPKPHILFNVLNESSLDFRVLFWTDNYDDWLRIRSEVLLNIYHALVDAEITIPFPQRDLHIKDLSTLDTLIHHKNDDTQ